VPWAGGDYLGPQSERAVRASGNLDRAGKAEQTLAMLRDVTAKQNNVYWANQIEVQRREGGGMDRRKNTGNKSDAISKMRTARSNSKTAWTRVQ